MRQAMIVDTKTAWGIVAMVAGSNKDQEQLCLPIPVLSLLGPVWRLRGSKILSPSNGNSPSSGLRVGWQVHADDLQLLSEEQLRKCGSQACLPIKRVQ